MRHRFGSIITLAAMAAALAAAIAPATASAATAVPAVSTGQSCLHDRMTLDYCTVTYASPRYTGWTYLESTCPANAYCIYAGSINTWTWSGSAWSKSRLNAAQWVYVHPYTGSWRWVWTKATGWQATTEGRYRIP